MTQRSASWEAIFRPGRADDFFTPEPPGAFDPQAAVYSPVNAWWLSEMARLVYRRDPGPNGTPVPTRSRILAAVGMMERETFRDGNLFAALFESAPEVQTPFAVLVFRGSSGHLDNWLTNFTTRIHPWPTGGKVHGGFKRALLGFWPPILTALRNIDHPVFYTGHSLGAALATLAASLRPPRALYTFGSPRVGDGRFARQLASLPVFRIANPHDIVTVLPPAFPFGYRHVGQIQPFEPYRRWQPGPDGYRLAPETTHQTDGGSIWHHVARRLAGPPVFLADHAPVGYTDGLIQECGGSS